MCFSSQDHVNQIVSTHSGGEGQLRVNQDVSGPGEESHSTLQATRSDSVDGA